MLSSEDVYDAKRTRSSPMSVLDPSSENHMQRVSQGLHPQGCSGTWQNFHLASRISRGELSGSLCP